MNGSGGPPDDTPVVRQPTDSNPLAMAIVRAVAAAEDADPQSLAPLGDVIDVAALEAVLASAGGTVEITFTYAEHRVVVTEAAIEVY